MSQETFWLDPLPPFRLDLFHLLLRNLDQKGQLQVADENEGSFPGHPA